MKTIKIPIYECTVRLYITKNINKSANKIYKKNDCKDILTDNPAAYHLYFEMDAYYLFINTTSISFNTICHELYHLVRSIAEDRGIKEEEATAWIQGYLADEIFKYILKKGYSLT